MYPHLSYKKKAGKLVGVGARLGQPDPCARYMDRPVAAPDDFILRHDLDG